MKDGRLLIVDDEVDMLTGLSRTLARKMPELIIDTADNASDALAFISSKAIDVALIDICMPEMTGIELLEQLRAKDMELTVIMMTAYGTIETAVEAMKKGAYDFITKPFDNVLLVKTISKGLERNQLLRENSSLKEMVCQHEALSGFIGQSKAMLNLYKQIQMLARSQYTVLIRGESGTGKGIAARALHNLSPRKNKKNVVVNCPAIPEHLLESELFGYKKGAFTGADRDQKGLFSEADGGTICLDEIGDVSLATQTKLLRVLEEQEIKPLGSVKTEKIDIRIIAMTNQDLESKISQHTFREDLFYRLNIVNIKTPSLRDIREDIPLLAEHFLKKICCELDIEERKFSPGAIEKLQKRAWPGNVREFQNVIRQIVLFSPNKMIEGDAVESTNTSNHVTTNEQRNWEFGSEGEGIKPFKKVKKEFVDHFTNEYITELLSMTKGNVSQAAKISGLTRTSLHRILSRTKKQ